MRHVLIIIFALFILLGNAFAEELPFTDVKKTDPYYE
jgi:hypothetical protein